MKTSFTTNTSLADFPGTELWRLLCDGWQHRFGKNVFSEAYFKGMETAFKEMLSYIKKDINLDFLLLEKLHEIAFEHMPQDEKEQEMLEFGELKTSITEKFKKNNPEVISIFSIGWNDRLTAFHSVSDQGIKELAEIFWDAYCEKPEAPAFIFLDFIKQGDGVGVVKASSIYNELKSETDKKNFIYNVSCILKLKKDIQLCSPLNYENKKSYINGLLSAFNNVKNEEGQEDILKRIFTLVRKIHYIHPFQDGNGRINFFILLNYLLLKNNLSPFINMTPFHISGYSLDEIIKEYEQGVEMFKQFSLSDVKFFLDSNYLVKEDVLKLNEKLSKNAEAAICQINALYINLGNDDTAEIKKGILKKFYDYYMTLFFYEQSNFYNTKEYINFYHAKKLKPLSHSFEYFREHAIFLNMTNSLINTMFCQSDYGFLLKCRRLLKDDFIVDALALLKKRTIPSKIV